MVGRREGLGSDFAAALSDSRQTDGDSYSYNGKNYHMPRHGFAMDMDFEFSNQTDSSVELSFSSSSESGLREIYPFDFSLRSVFSF